jgi:hypothetical protein
VRPAASPQGLRVRTEGGEFGTEAIRAQLPTDERDVRPNRALQEGRRRLGTRDQRLDFPTQF